MKFRMTLVAEDLSEFVRHVRLADSLGFDVVVGDSQTAYRELYVCLTLAALNTKRAIIGPWVTNPVTRHPAVTASAVSSIEELAPGRTVIGIGTGDSAVYNLGLKPTSIEELDHYIRALRELWDSGLTLYHGKTIRLTWAKRRIPVYIAAGGPKTLRYAGRHGDGVIVGTGLLPEVIHDTLEHIDAGAKESGRRVEDMDIWWLCKMNPSTSRKAATQEMKNSLAATANHSFRFSPEGKRLPPELLPAVRKLQENYVFHEHVKVGANKPNGVLLEELGLLKYMADRFLVGGTPDECVEQLRRIHAAGAKNLWLGVHMADKDTFMNTLAAKIAPQLPA
ncbi:MAG: LLM class flavin-dependent oxidoreductase [Dehalococcoidia bacterium]|nr:LLM class flavin-dependent oxidoreductase [Dehalococcoidia bacterium]